MSKLSTAKELMLHHKALFCDSIIKNFFGFLPDKLYLSLRYRCQMGRWINWKHPKTFTEKLQWLKIYDYKPEYTQMVDKLAAKDYVAKRIGKEYIIPTLGVWDRVEDIDWDSLPNQFVLKTTHGGGGGGVVVCKDKRTLNREKAVEKLRSSMRSNAGRTYREKPYLNVPRRIIAEKFMAERSPVVSSDLIDYKYYCFNGVPKLIMVANERSTGDKRFAYYDTQWNPVHIKWGAPRPDKEFPRPDNLDEMLRVASKLSAGLTHARIDLYNIDAHVYFGEITFYDGSGFEKIDPQSYDEYLGSLMKLKETVMGGGKIKVYGNKIESIPISYGYKDLQDYKFFCFGGEPKYCQVIRDRSEKETIDFYDMEWRHMPFVGLNPVARNGLNPVAKPQHLETMKDICRKLSKNMRFSRIDLYVIGDKEYFGEITLYPAAGLGKFDPAEWNAKLGDLIKLDGNQLGGVKIKVYGDKIESIPISYEYKDLPDYKFFCFGGEVKCFKIDFGRFVEHHANYYYPDGELLPFGEIGLEPDPNHVEIMPVNLSEMISVAERLSAGFKFLRVDLYNVKGKIYFGELTFYPAAGMGAFVPDEWDEKLGNWIE